MLDNVISQLEIPILHALWLRIIPISETGNLVQLSFNFFCFLDLEIK